MTLTSDNDTTQRTTTVRIAIRVPNGGNDELVTDAEQRLTRAADVVRATIDELHEIEPGLSATRVTAMVTVESRSSLPPPELRTQLADVSGIEPLEAEENADS